MNRVKNLEVKIDEKVDNKKFDNEIASIRDLIGNMDDDNKKKPI